SHGRHQLGTPELNPLERREQYDARVAEAHALISRAQDLLPVMVESLRAIAAATTAGPDLVVRYLSLPAEFRSRNRLRELIEGRSSPQQLRDPLRRAEVEVAISRMPEDLRVPMNRLLDQPDGLTTAQRIVRIVVLTPELINDIGPLLRRGS